MRESKRLRRSAACALAVVAVVVAAVWAVWLSGAFAPEAELPSPSAMLISAWNELDASNIDASLDVERATLTVTHALHLRNRTGQAQDSDTLRAWANAFQTADTFPCAFEEERYAAFYPTGFSAGSLAVERARVNGADAQHRYTDGARTTLALPVAGGWQPDAWVDVELKYTVNIPRLAYRFGVNEGIWALGNAFVVPAPWRDGAFRADAYAPVGDPFVSDCMNYTVRVELPRGYACAGSGWAREERVGERSVYRFASSAVRDFALVVSDRFELACETRDGVLVAAYATSKARARELLSCAKRALACYAEHYGEYPYQSFTAAEVDFPVGGMEYPAMVMIASDALDAGGETLDAVVAHEAAHQWWYAVVGSDSWYQPWQDEALCEYSVMTYWGDTYGEAARNEREQRQIEPSLRVTVPRGVTPGAPLDVYSGLTQYALVAYQRGAAMFLALERALPEGALEEFLRAYYRRYAFGFATREDFERMLAEVTGEDFAPLMRDYLDTYILN